MLFTFFCVNFVSRDDNLEMMVNIKFIILIVFIFFFVKIISTYQSNKLFGNYLGTMTDEKHRYDDEHDSVSPSFVSTCGCHFSK